MNRLFTLLSVFSKLCAFAQCALITTASGVPVSCNGDCNGMIYYTYQNTMTGNPGAPYVVTLTNQTTGQLMGSYTYTTEGQTIQYQNLCAGTYLISIQGNNCTSQTTAIVTQPTPVSGTVNVVDPAPGQNNGTATIIAQGGVAPYTYSLNGTNYQSSNVLSGLSAGNYTGYIQDANNCIETVQFELDNPATCSMVVTANGSSVLCYGACNAVIQYSYTLAGASPCVIELQNQNGQVLQTQTNASTAGSGSFTDVCSGVYFIEVTDANGCVATYAYTVGQPAQLTITNVATTNSAYGSPTGSATITAAGGIAPYTYSLNGTNYQSSNVFSGLAAGVHVAYVKDANGCVSIYTFVVQETTACILFMSSNSVPVQCYGSSTGSILYAYNNAVAPVSVVLQSSNGATMQSQTSQTDNGQGTFSTVPAGNYYIVVTDAAGCTFTNNITVSGPTSWVNATATTNSSTSGMNNGSITVNASGGTAPYMYSLNNSSNWQSSNSFVGLAAGVYIIYVQDANGCMIVITVQLTQVTGCTQAIVGTPDHVDCALGNNGSINFTFTSSGVGAPYTVNLINNGTTVQTSTFATPASSGTFSNLASGVYTLQLIGANGCISTAQVYVDQPDPLMVSNVTVTNATAGMSDGSAVVIVTGGTAPYTYTLNNGAPGTSSTLDGLAAGVYIMWVEDANGCTTVYCFIVNESPSCPSIAVTMAETQSITCNGACNGSLSWAYTSGGDPGLYEVTLMEGNNTISVNTYTSTVFQGVYNNLCAGNYSITVTEPNGCTATYNYELQEPDQMLVSGTSTNATAGSNNGTITMAVTGGSGQYEYSLNNPTNWQGSNVFTGLSAGMYVVYVRDENGCIQAYTIQVGTTGGCNMAVTATQAASSSCGGSCNESILYSYTTTTGGSPFTVILTDQNGNTQTQTQTSSTMSGTFSGLCEGIYTVTVQASNGCTGIYTVQVVVPDYMTIGVNTTEPTPGNADGAFTMNVTGGTPSYQYSIDNQNIWQTTGTFTDLSAGVYFAFTKDANACTQVTAVKLGQITTGILELGDNIKAYPNPTNNFVFLESITLDEYSVTTLSGQKSEPKIYAAANGMIFDFSDLTRGIYLVQFDYNGKKYSLKIIRV